MDNTHLPSGGDEHASRPTEQFWSGPGPAGHPGGEAGYRAPGDGGAGYRPQAAWHQEAGPSYDGPAYGGPSYGGPGGPHEPRDRRRTMSWGAGLALIALLAGGGVIAGVALAGNSPPGRPAASSAGALAAAPGAAGPAGQAAVLNAALSSADSPTGPAYLDSSGAVASVASGAASGAGAAGPAAVGPAARCLRARAAARAAGRPGLARRIRIACLRPVLRRLALRGVHGEFTFRAGDGFRTVAFERGTIQSVSSGQDIVVRAPDGITWTWDLVSSTVVRENGAKVGTGALAAGEQVWTGGPVVQGSRDSRLIVIRPPSGSPAPSPSAG